MRVRGFTAWGIAGVDGLSPGEISVFGAGENVKLAIAARAAYTILSEVLYNSDQ